MAAVTFMTHNTEKIVSEVARMLYKDLCAETLPACQVLPAESGGVPAGSLLAEVPRATWDLPMALHIYGSLESSTTGAIRDSNVEPLYFLDFNLTQPRRMELQACVSKAGLAATVHRLTYVVPLSKSVAGQVSLEPAKKQMSGTPLSPFSGHVETATLLNRDNMLLKLANQLAAVRMTYDQVSLGIERCLMIYPRPTGSLLLLHTLPRLMLARWSLWAGEVLALASAIETAL